MARRKRSSSRTTPPDQATGPPVGLHRLAQATAAAALILLIAGGLVTSTGSGLSVPDWPLSFGTLFPKMEGGVLYEHSHRLIAGTVLILTLVLTVWILRLRFSGGAAGLKPRRSVCILVAAAMTAVIVQALLGGATVLLQLPRAVSISHAGLAQIFFALICGVAAVTSPAWMATPARPLPDLVRRLFIITTAAVYLQILLGAVMRHHGAGLAFPDFPLSNGRLIPPLNTFSEQVNFAHRAGALAVVLLVLAAASAAWKRRKTVPLLHQAAIGLPLIVLFQASLGAFSVWHRLPVLTTAAHVGGAGLLFAGCFTITLKSFRV